MRSSAARSASRDRWTASGVLSLERAKLESLLEREPLIVYRVMRAILRVVHVILNRLAIESGELTNYMFKVRGKY